MQMGPGMRQPQVQRPVVNPQLPQVPSGPLRTAGQVGAPIYNPSGPQPVLQVGGTPVTAPVIAPRPTAGPMPATPGGIANTAGNVGAPAVANANQGPNPVGIMRR